MAVSPAFFGRTDELQAIVEMVRQFVDEQIMQTVGAGGDLSRLEQSGEGSTLVCGCLVAVGPRSMLTHWRCTPG